MDKKKTKRLSLSRETLRSLHDGDLRNVVGQASSPNYCKSEDGRDTCYCTIFCTAGCMED